MVQDVYTITSLQVTVQVILTAKLIRSQQKAAHLLSLSKKPNPPHKKHWGKCTISTGYAELTLQMKTKI